MIRVPVLSVPAVALLGADACPCRPTTTTVASLDAAASTGGNEVLSTATVETSSTGTTGMAFSCGKTTATSATLAETSSTVTIDTYTIVTAETAPLSLDTDISAVTSLPDTSIGNATDSTALSTDIIVTPLVETTAESKDEPTTTTMLPKCVDTDLLFNPNFDENSASIVP